MTVEHGYVQTRQRKKSIAPLHLRPGGKLRRPEGPLQSSRQSNGPASAPRDPAACRPVRGGMEKRVDHHGAQRRGRDAGQPRSRGEPRGDVPDSSPPSGSVGIERGRGEVADSDVESRRLFGRRCAGSGVKSFRTG